MSSKQTKSVFHCSPLTAHCSLALNYFAYFSEIEETFVRRRGKNLLLSPLDWALIESWKERGVPLHIVLRALNEVFDNAEQQHQSLPSARKRNIKSLVYCREAVEMHFAAWHETQIGVQSPKSKVQSPKSEDVDTEIPRDAVFAHFQKVQKSLQNSRPELNGSWQKFSTEILSAVTKAKDAFQASGELEKLENILNALDGRVDEKLPQLATEDTINQVKTETAAQLRTHKNKMSAEAYRQTFETLFIKNLRERVALPRFSLVYL